MRHFWLRSPSLRQPDFDIPLFCSFVDIYHPLSFAQSSFVRLLPKFRSSSRLIECRARPSFVATSCVFTYGRLAMTTMTGVLSQHSTIELMVKAGLNFAGDAEQIKPYSKRFLEIFEGISITIFER